MNKSKFISIILNVIFIIIIVSLIAYITFYNKKNDNAAIVEDLSTKCTKTIQDESNIKTYIEETVYYNENNSISDDKTLVIYVLADDETYNTIKNNLNECEDTYKIDKKITCHMVMSSDKSKIIGTWAYKYITNAKDNGFTCE